MMPRELRRALRAFEAPNEEDARKRAWAVVQVAFDERERVRARKRPVRALVGLAFAAAVVAAAVSPAGQAVLDSLRRAVGVERPQAALFSLPAPGRLLVVSDAGAWVVARDGSKRFLGSAADAGWSPTGRFVAVARRDELAALTPDGETRWKLARPGVRLPRWGGTRTDTRIAYFAGAPLELRVVAGDGSPDRLVASRPRLVAPAWRPGAEHVLAASDARGTISVYAVDRGAVAGRSAPGEPPIELAWSPDGKRLLALARHSLRLLDARARATEPRRAPAGARNVTAAFHPTRPTYALVRYRARADRSEVVLANGRRVFDGTGRFTDLAWSPDGRWLVVAWRDADQLVFVRTSGARRIEAVANVSRQFESARFPRIAGWVL